MGATYLQVIFETNDDISDSIVAGGQLSSLSVDAQFLKSDLSVINSQNLNPRANITLKASDHLRNYSQDQFYVLCTFWEDRGFWSKTGVTTHTTDYDQGLYRCESSHFSKFQIISYRKEPQVEPYRPIFPKTDDTLSDKFFVRYPQYSYIVIFGFVLFSFGFFLAGVCMNYFDTKTKVRLYNS